MTRLLILATLTIAIAFIPFAGAASSGSTGGGGSGGGDIHGRIQSVTSTNFSVGTHPGHHHHRHLKPIVVHYNPDSVNLTVDGVAVHSLDVAATGKYVSVVGTMKNNVLEATSIAVTSAAPEHRKPIKSKNPA